MVDRPDQPERPVQTDNRPRPDDGPQDLPQQPGSVVRGPADRGTSPVRTAP